MQSGKQSHSKEIGEREMSMYDVSLLNSLNKTKHDLPTNWTVRPLQLSDYNKGTIQGRIIDFWGFKRHWKSFLRTIRISIHFNV